ncbi:hypothetical protein [Rubinisphaera brasiliensis]|uniref:DUF3150 domain-containing protein n=1 Tax=Rubinisphaera brasiliensis (strain ATCC 49424 / DSM 5305 / JCM 21570 / IAM 15109 / NBRC 103401 / IFAM 1448) TaxID=756272 RepID=F0SS45_RUBBR|nr:hypothetical protein [Rubinisphaera brasiliensis]ADY61383.1 hypothetical protein Plabr_3796 [Rubinisphaera brasiliensis DSM 5305]
MSTTLVEEPTASHPAADSPSSRLRGEMTAARLSFTWLGVRKSLSSQQKEQAADSFGAEGKFLSAGKKLLDTSHPAFKAVTAIKGRAVSYWKGVSLPYPESGIRLIRRDAINVFDEQITVFRNDLEHAVRELNVHYDELRHTARERLGDLFDVSDYPPSLVGAFEINHDYPSVEPPDYLRQLNPELYEQEVRRMQARFDEAVELAEHAFIDELSRLVSHLTERLSGHGDGNPKVFRDTAVENLTEFFSRFQSLNVRSNDQLDSLVDQCRSIVSGVAPQRLRDDLSLRQQVGSQLSGVQSVLDGLLVDRPRRRIVRLAK